MKWVHTKNVLFVEKLIYNLTLKRVGINFYSVNTPKLRIALVTYLSTSSRNGQNGGDNFPTFVLDRHTRSRPEVSD